MIRVEIVADSLHPADGGRLTTMKLTLPRRGWVHVLTHAMFARNAGSFRATPFKRIVRGVLTDPAYPEHWGLNQPGMQARVTAPLWKARVGVVVWKAASVLAVLLASILARLGLHKEVVNYLLEPFAHTDGLVTGTDQAWANFFALRNHPDAHPTIRGCAELAYDLYRRGTPKRLELGEWHAPYMDMSSAPRGGVQGFLKRSVARCARVSLSTFDRPEVESDEVSDLRLYQDLMGSTPKHASPAGHQACAVASNKVEDAGCLYLYGRRCGWLQYRKTIKNDVTLELPV